VDEAIKSGDWDGCGPVGNGRGRQKKTNDLGALKSELCKRPTKILIKFYDVHHGFILEFQTDSGTFGEERERDRGPGSEHYFFLAFCTNLFKTKKLVYKFSRKASLRTEPREIVTKLLN
jgi:hypothetical protein